MTTVIQFPELREPLTAVVSGEVRALMGRHGVSQTELAHWLGVNQTAISARLRGTTEWKVREIERIAEGFGVHPAALMGGYATNPDPGPGSSVPILETRHTGEYDDRIRDLRPCHRGQGVLTVPDGEQEAA